MAAEHFPPVPSYSREFPGVPGSSRPSVQWMCNGLGEGEVVMTRSEEGVGVRRNRRRVLDPDVRVRPLCGLTVAGVAAYASYVHQRAFAMQGGADRVSDLLWPLSVDGLSILATVGLLKPTGPGTRRARGAVWSAFLLGIVVSLAADIEAAPAPAWKPVLVAGWPPVALLLSVELLVHRPAVPKDRGLAPPETATPARVNGQPGQGGDPLLARARVIDAQHREVHQRPASAETLRKELHVGAGRSRQLVNLVRGIREGSIDAEALRDPTDGEEGLRSDWPHRVGDQRGQQGRAMANGHPG